jgi:hydroxyethylthiazole kinase-like uncharacterized protein yjeF
MSQKSNVSYITGEKAQEIDKELMGPEQGFSLEQLMENAGISVAHAVVQFLDKDYKEREMPSSNKQILIVCGPGNNGGDGLVAARHLFHFGFKPTVVYAKEASKETYKNLLKQLTNLDVQILREIPDAKKIDSTYALLVDAVFGFSFKGNSLKEPFDRVIGVMKQCNKCPIMAVDVPSGWDVDKGNIHRLGPDNVSALISLTVPKLCAKEFNGIHYLGGRFVPPKLSQKYNITIPHYQGIDTIVKL